MLNELKIISRTVILGLILTISISLLASLSSISLMGLSAFIVASASLKPPLYTLSLAIVGVRFCGISRALFRYLERYLTHKIGFMLFTKFEVFVLKKIIEVLPFKCQSSNDNVFDIIVNAIDTLRDSFLRFFIPPIMVSFVCMIIVIWSIFYSKLLVLIILIAWLVFVIVMPLIFLNLYDKKIKNKFNLTKDIMDFYEGNLEILANNYDKYRLKTIKNSIKEYQEYKTKMFILKSRVDLICEILLGLFITISLFIVIYLVNNNAFNAVMAITILLTFQAVLEILCVIPTLTEHIDEAKRAWQQLKPFVYWKNQHEVIEKNKTMNLDAILSVENMSYGYDELLYTDMNFSLKKGEKTLLVGESGCGKSTLFFVLTKMLQPKKGNIFFKGKNYALLPAKQIRQQIAVSFQEHHIFNMSIRDNFKMFYPNITDKEIINALNSLQLEKLVKENGLDFLLLSNGENLSGGQKHRLQLAICLAQNKDIILLDEPTANLDLSSANEFLKHLMSVYKDKTLLVASHDLSIIDYFDNIIILGNKKIKEMGKIKELLADEHSSLSKMIKYHNLV